MQKLKIVVCGTFIFVGEIILILLLLSAVNNFFPRDVRPFIPDSSNYIMIATLYLIRIFFLAVVIMLLRREIILARKDWANPGNFWFLRKMQDSLKDKVSTGF